MLTPTRRSVLQSLLATAASAALPMGAVSAATVAPAAVAAPAPLAVPASDTALEWWDLFAALSKRDKLRYAQILRDADARFDELADRIDYFYGPVSKKEARGKQA